MYFFPAPLTFLGRFQHLGFLRIQHIYVHSLQREHDAGEVNSGHTVEDEHVPARFAGRRLRMDFHGETRLYI